MVHFAVENISNLVEYISEIEGTAPPLVFQTFDFPNLSLPLLCQTGM